MPCDSSYMEPTWNEREAEKLLMIWDEVANGNTIDPQKYGKGYSYESMTSEERDDLTIKLCSKLKDEQDITKYSLEVQIWWRDHQTADNTK